MSKISLKSGRVNQKLQTRTMILNSARDLMNKSEKISLEDVAKKAKVSRATIYRYFPNIELLFTEASLDIHHLSADELMDRTKSMSFDNRLFFIQKYYNQLAEKHEMGFRRYLIAALTESIENQQKKIRGARRLETLRKSLEPYKKEFSKKEFENLIYLSAMLMGIDSLIVAKDVCDLSAEEAQKIQKWGLKMVLKGMSRDL